MDDQCPICFEAHNGGGPPAMQPVVCQPCSPIWRWPCGHGVHAGCIAQTRTSLLTVNGPCYVCRHACHKGALDNFKRAFPFMGLSQILDQVPDDEPLGQVPQAYIPNVAALCCPRLAGPFDGAFVALPSDRRMSYMGMGPRGLMSWTCMTCHKETHLQEIPRVAHACLQHGPMCYVLEVFPQLPPPPLGPAACPYRDNYARRYWSCCNATQQGDSPLPIDHLHPGDDRPFRNQDPMMAADIESIEDSIPDEDSFPDRSMDHSSVDGSEIDVDGSEIEAVLEEAAIEEAAIVQMRYMGYMGDDAEIPEAAITEAEIAAATEEAAIEEASWYEIDGTERVLARDPIARDDVLASGDRPPWNPIARDALFGDDVPMRMMMDDVPMRRIQIAMMDDPDEPFHTGAEVEMFQRIVRDYETAEEQIAMEALLSGYTDE